MPSTMIHTVGSVPRYSNLIQRPPHTAYSIQSQRAILSSSSAFKPHKRRCSTLATVTGTISDTPDQLNKTDQSEALVSSILEAIKDTDFGDKVTPKQRAEIDDTLQVLEEVGQQQGPPLENPLVYGNYEVSYTSTLDRSPPAGGRFRTGLGKFLWRTTGLYQAILQPDLVVNKLEFRLFGMLPGYVGLRGRLQPLTSLGGGASADPRAVRVGFGTPVISLMGLVLRIGPPSFVVLSTTYLDERVRLGKGGRGTLFVFTRTDNDAGMDEVGVVGSTPGAKVGAVLLSGLWGAACGMLVATRRLPLVCGGVVLAGLLLALLYTVWRGGQAGDDVGR